jgi:hypothetical protein
MNRRIKGLLLAVALLALTARGAVMSQELYCNVQVSAQKIRIEQGGFPEHAA